MSTTTNAILSVPCIHHVKVLSAVFFLFVDVGHSKMSSAWFCNNPKCGLAHSNDVEKCTFGCKKASGQRPTGLRLPCCKHRPATDFGASLPPDVVLYRNLMFVFLLLCHCLRPPLRCQTQNEKNRKKSLPEGVFVADFVTSNLVFFPGGHRYLYTRPLPFLWGGSRCHPIWEPCERWENCLGGIPNSSEAVQQPWAVPIGDDCSVFAEKKDR